MVLKAFLGGRRGYAGFKQQRMQAAPAREIDPDRLRTFIDFFPIGKRLRYSPDFKKEIVFDTFIVGYRVNGNSIYSADAIDRDAQGRPTVFHTGTGEQRTPIARPQLFQVLLPDTTDLELKLDYHRRALIGRGGHFQKGRSISLVSHIRSKGVSTVDTEVADRIVLPDGPYEQTNMILLTPELHTLSLGDQRRRARAQVSAPVTVSLPQKGVAGHCTIMDMSESAMHIRMPGGDVAMAEMRAGAVAILDIDLGAAQRHYSLTGTAIRRTPETCVIRLDGLFRDGRFANILPLELLELKVGLLNYGM